MKSSMAYEEKRVGEILRKERRQQENLNGLLALLDKCEKASLRKDISIDELIDLFKTVKESYPDEFLLFNLAELSIPLMAPMLKSKMTKWTPFKSDDDDDDDDDELGDEEMNDLECCDLNYCFELYADLNSLFKDMSSFISYQRKQLSPFHRIIWDTWMPSVRRLIFQCDLRKQASNCADLLSLWSKLVPSWMINNLLEQIIVPKLTSEVESWNPLTDTVPIHIWIHPWLPFIREHLETNVFPIIRFKLSNALNLWHPSDASAKAILLPWKPPVFSSGHWDAFMCKNVVPKLEKLLDDELVINPSEQNLDPWTWTFDWYDLISFQSFVSLLEKHFFNKWLQTLCIWLNSSADPDEVSKWYIGWKNQFNEKLKQHPNIKSKFSQALMLMSKSADGIKVSYEPSVADKSSDQPKSSHQQSSNESSRIDIANALKVRLFFYFNLFSIGLIFSIFHFY